MDPIKCEEAGDSSLGNGDNDKPANIKRRLQSKSECNIWISGDIAVKKSLKFLLLFFILSL